jgi:hypothetical protein
MTPIAKDKKDRPTPEQKHRMALVRIEGIREAREITLQKLEHRGRKNGNTRKRKRE